MTFWLGLMYLVIPSALILWALQRRRKVDAQAIVKPEATMPEKKSRLLPWVLVAMAGTACLLAFGFLDSHHNVQHLTTQDAQKVIATTPGIQVYLMQLRNNSSYFLIRYQKEDKQVFASAPADDSTLALIKVQGINCPTYVHGCDFEVFGWPRRLLPILCVFILAIGAVVLLRRPGRLIPIELDGQQIQKIQRMEKTVNRGFGTIVSFGLIVGTILVALTTDWHGRAISGAQAQQYIAEHKNGHYVIFKYRNGSREIWMGTLSATDYVAPVDDSTVKLLAKQGSACPTMVQGRDFGIATPRPRASILTIALLLAGRF